MRAYGKKSEVTRTKNFSHLSENHFALIDCNNCDQIIAAGGAITSHLKLLHQLLTPCSF